MLVEKTFSEPRLITFHDVADKTNNQAFIVAEKEIVFEVTSFSLEEWLLSLIDAYYAFFVKYRPKSSPAASTLIFMQEILLELPDASKKTAKYKALVNSIL